MCPRKLRVTWLDFLQREAATRVYAKGEVILSQFSETDALFQVLLVLMHMPCTRHTPAPAICT